MQEKVLDFISRFASVSFEDIDELVSMSEMKSFEKKVKLIDIGEPEMHMYYILSGLTRKYFFRGKDEVITHIVKEGGLIGSAASFFSGKPSRYIIETLEPTSVLRISKQNMEKLYSSSKKWEKIGRLLVTNYFLVQEMQLLDNIKLTTKERLNKFVTQNPDLVQRVPQKYIASLLNIKPETFSRLKTPTDKNK